MTVWMVFGGLTAAVLLILIRPLMRSAPASVSRADYDQAIYRDQLAEVERDVARGVVSEAEAAAIRAEVARRLLAAAGKSSPGEDAATRVLRPAPTLATILILIVPAAAIGLYAGLGAPDSPDRPFADRAVERSIENDDGSLDVAKVKTALEARLAKNTGSLQGWVLLARTDATTQDWAGARAAWEKAVTLSHGDSEILEDYGEMLVTQANGTVGPQAQAIFRRAVAARHDAFRARFYLGGVKLQAGDRAGAVAAWRAVQHDAPPGSPWRSQIDAAIAALDQPEQPTAPVAAAPGGDSGMAGALMSLPPDQRAQAIQGMVAGLAAKLKQNPDDLAGWKRLARSYQVLGQPQRAADAFAHAAKLDPKDPLLLVGEADSLGSAGGQGQPPSDKMLELYRQVLVLDPKQVDALWMLGFSAHGGHQDKLAAQYWQTLLTVLDPASQDYAEVKKALASLDKS